MSKKIQEQKFISAAQLKSRMDFIRHRNGEVLRVVFIRHSTTHARASVTSEARPKSYSVQMRADELVEVL